MENQITILIVEDHPIISEAYKLGMQLFKKEHPKHDLNILSACNCDEALDVIKFYAKIHKKIDYVFLDIKIPPSKTNPKIKSGEDIGKKFRNTSPKTKIVIVTMITGNYSIMGIIKTINPEGFLIKNDITHNEITTVLDKLFSNEVYYSKTILECLRQKVTNDFTVEDVDRHILYELSIGTKTVEIEQFVPLSRSTINRRKNKMKVLFNLSDTASDRELVLRAKEIGIL